MSNTNINSVEFDVVPCIDAPETLPEALESTQTEAPSSKKKTVACRIFSFLLIAVSVAALFLPIQVIKGFTPESTTLFASLSDLFDGGEVSKLFGVLPVYTNVAKLAGLFAGAIFYALVAAMALTAVFAMLALFSDKSGLLRTATFFFTTGFGTYAVCGYILPILMSKSTQPDLITISIASAGALLYLILSFAKKGKKAFASLFQLLFTLVFVAATVLAFHGHKAEITKTVNGFGVTFGLTAIIVFTTILVITLLGAMRLQTKKGLVLDLIRYIIQLLIGEALCYVAFISKTANYLLWVYAAVAAGVSLLQIIICIFQFTSAKAKKTVEEDTVVEQLSPIHEYTVEEYAEAFAYEGGPVEGVEVAQEVNPTFEENPIEPQVNTAGYDFYNSKSFDPFIAILNNEERNQFTEMFILKYKGVMPEIPDYQVGGDNKDFFRKVFIYLGQYRDRIPDGLLAKIYQFAIRNS